MQIPYFVYRANCVANVSDNIFYKIADCLNTRLANNLGIWFPELHCLVCFAISEKCGCNAHIVLAPRIGFLCFFGHVFRWALALRLADVFFLVLFFPQTMDFPQRKKNLALFLIIFKIQAKKNRKCHNVLYRSATRILMRNACVPRPYLSAKAF